MTYDNSFFPNDIEDLPPSGIDAVSRSRITGYTPTEIVAGVITTSVYLPTSVRATEAPVKYDLISTADAVKGAIPVTLYFGKIISLDFTDAREYITFIAPSDRSQFVYNTDLPANSGEAQSVYFLPIEKVDFKGTY